MNDLLWYCLGHYDFWKVVQWVRLTQIVLAWKGSSHKVGQPECSSSQNFYYCFLLGPAHEIGPKSWLTQTLRDLFQILRGEHYPYTFKLSCNKLVITSQGPFLHFLCPSYCMHTLIHKYHSHPCNYISRIILLFDLILFLEVSLLDPSRIFV